MNPEFGGANDIEAKKETLYQEIPVSSFSEGSSRIIEDESVKSKEAFSFFILDVDGALIDNNFIEQLPFVCHFFYPEVNNNTRRSFSELSNVFQGRMAIATNRDRDVRIFWNSDKVMKETDSIIESSGYNMPVFEKMQKQIPFLAQERIEKLVEYISKSFKEREDYESIEDVILFSMEDISIVSPIRKTFLMYIADKLSEELGENRRITINNFVIRNR